MTLAAVHLPAGVSVPVAVAVAAAIAWYWRTLAAAHVPESRRRIRRASAAVMLMGLPLLVVALSFADDQTAPTLYLVAWLLVLFTVAVVVLTAGADVVNTLRLEHQRHRQEIERATSSLSKAIRAARGSAIGSGQGTRGSSA